MRPRFLEVWRSRQGLAALLVVVVATVWRWWLVSDSYFNQDDYYLTSRASSSGLTWSFFVNGPTGHFNPAQQLVYWTVARLAPFDWPAVAAFVVVLQTMALVVLWYLLSRLLPGSWLRLPLLISVAIAPLTLTSTLWWSAAMGVWPPMLALVAAVIFLLRADEDVRWRWANLVGCVAATVVGLAWHERAILIPPFLLGVAICIADDASGWRRVTVALRRFLPLWISLGVLGAAFLILYSQVTEVAGGAVSVRQAAVVAGAYVAENVVPGLVGGPWVGTLKGGAVVPRVWVDVVAFAAVALGVVALLRHGGPARRWALGLLAGYVGAEMAMVIAGRGGFGRVIGLDSRYSAAIVMVAAICVALALRGAPIAAPAESKPGVSWSGGWRRTTLEVTALFTAGAVIGTALLVPHFQNREDRSYFTNLKRDLATNPNQVIVDQPVPVDILLPLLGEEAMLSSVLAPLPDVPLFDQPSPDLRVVEADGHLREPFLYDAVAAKDGPVPGCGYALTSRLRTVPLEDPIGGKFVMRIGYFTQDDGSIEVSVPGHDWSVSVGVVGGPHLTYVVVPDLGEPVTSLRMGSETAQTVCVTGVLAGSPVNPRDEP